MRHLLFACVHNSGRSQMAEAFAKRLSDGTIEFESAGANPSDRLNPVVVEAMRERGIDISQAKPKLITQEMAGRVDRVITMGCAIAEACPALRTPTEDWALDDPHGKTIEEVRVIRDQIDTRVQQLVREEAR